MNLRENVSAILHYEKYDSMPIVSFGYWTETLKKWAEEGHISKIEAIGYARYGDNSKADKSIMAKLGFDFNWNSCFETNYGLLPSFKPKILQENPDGSYVMRDEQGLIVLKKDGITSIPSEIGTTLTNRAVWEKEYLPRLQWLNKRVDTHKLKKIKNKSKRKIPVGLHCGSLGGYMRNLLGFEQFCYLYSDDEELFGEIVDTLSSVCYNCTKAALESGVEFDYAHFWEDICFKNGPMISPQVFNTYFGKHYKRISELLNSYGIDIISVDCDGLIDALLPVWLENGVNTMFPIEVGSWNASLAPWREKYGKVIRGVGGMNKNVFALDYVAVDHELERLKPLIELGGYIPCPDHRIAPDAKFENVQYYCEGLRKICSK